MGALGTALWPQPTVQAAASNQPTERSKQPTWGTADFARLADSVVVTSPPKLQALVYDILPWRKVPEGGARNVVTTITATGGVNWLHGVFLLPTDQLGAVEGEASTRLATLCPHQAHGQCQRRSLC